MTHSYPRDILLELDRLESMRGPSPHQGGSQREFDRFIVRGDAELSPVNRSTLNREPMEIKLRDASLGGIGFISLEPLQSGEVFRICFMAGNYPVADSTILIRHCRPVSEGLYLCGAQFCASAGLLALLGVDAQDIHHQINRNDDGEIDFYTPDEVDDTADGPGGPSQHAA